MTANLESIKNRIRALAAKTVENGCTEAEAIAAMNKVGELLTAYGLSMSQVELEAETYITHRINTGRKQRHAVYMVVTSIAAFTETKVWVNRTKTELNYSFFGQESDVLMAHYLYDLIVLSIDSETRTFKLTELYKHSTSRKGATVSFQNGMANRLAGRFQEMVAERREDMKAAGRNALVVIKKDLVEQAYQRDIGAKLRNVNVSSRVRNAGAYKHGQNCANNVNLNRPLNQGEGVAAITGY